VVAAAVVVTPVLMVGGGGALLVGMVWGDAMDELVVESFMDMDLRMVGVHGSPAQAHLNDLVRHAITDPMVMNIGFWELLWFEIEFDEAIADGFVTDAELRSLHQRYGRITSS